MRERSGAEPLRRRDIGLAVVVAGRRHAEQRVSRLEEGIEPRGVSDYPREGEGALRLLRQPRGGGWGAEQFCLRN